MFIEEEDGKEKEFLTIGKVTSTSVVHIFIAQSYMTTSSPSIIWVCQGLRTGKLKSALDWILKFERIQKRILRFFINQSNPRSLGSWCVKGTEESSSGQGFFGSFDVP